MRERRATREDVKEYERALYKKYSQTDVGKRANVASSFKYRNRITIEERDAMLARQGGCCARCKTTKPGKKRGWMADHCHDTGKIRGILCMRCNVEEGIIKKYLAEKESWDKYLKIGETK